MKKAFTLFVIVLLGSACLSSQNGPGGPPAPLKEPGSVNVPAAKIALVNTNKFYDEKTGIPRLVQAIKKVDSEFGPQQKEMESMTKRLESMAGGLQNSERRHPLTSEQMQTKTFEYEQFKETYSTREKEVKEAYEKRNAEVVKPITDEIGAALDEFSKEHGITLTLDVSKMEPALLTFDPATDITDAFILHFNKRPQKK